MNLRFYLCLVRTLPPTTVSFFFLLGQNFARNLMVSLSGRQSGTFVHSPASINDKDPYELSVTSEPSVCVCMGGGGGVHHPFQLRLSGYLVQTWLRTQHKVLRTIGVGKLHNIERTNPGAQWVGGWCIDRNGF